MINNVTLVGRLTKDPELRFTPNGDAVCNFTLAVNRNFKNANGETEADFIMCQVWRKPAENVANFLKKGSLAGLTGSIRTRSYDKDGQRIYVTEVLADSVQFLEPKGSGGRNDQGLGDAAGQINNYSNQGQNQNSSQGNYQNNDNQGNYQNSNQQRSNNSNQQRSQNQNQQRSQNQNQNNYQNQNQGNYQRYSDDPFAGGGQIDISDDDLPF